MFLDYDLGILFIAKIVEGSQLSGTIYVGLH